jgi:hypothetical protein
VRYPERRARLSGLNDKQNLDQVDRPKQFKNWLKADQIRLSMKRFIRR